MNFVNQPSDKSGRGKQYISGIHCDVTNCAYHDPQCKCSADNISVGPDYASSSADTVCSTFKQK
jgi:hypothetical protein